jgi:uncharacterized protein involved in tellurium resistance
MKKIKNNDGSTMVEVLVSFTVLMILMAGLTGIIKVSSDLIMQAKDMQDNQSAFVEEFYKEDFGSLQKDVLEECPDIKLQPANKTGTVISGENIILDHANLKKVSEADTGSAYIIYTFEE